MTYPRFWNNIRQSTDNGTTVMAEQRVNVFRHNGPSLSWLNYTMVSMQYSFSSKEMGEWVVINLDIQHNRPIWNKAEEVQRISWIPSLNPNNGVADSDFNLWKPLRRGGASRMRQWLKSTVAHILRRNPR